MELYDDDGCGGSDDWYLIGRGERLSEGERLCVCVCDEGVVVVVVVVL